MCSRVTLRSPLDRLQAIFGFDDELEFEARYNIAPTQPLLTLTSAPQASAGSEQAERSSAPSSAQNLRTAPPLRDTGPSASEKVGSTPDSPPSPLLRRARWMSWGLSAAGRAGGERSSQLIINARSETAHQLPTFRESFAHRRCVILVDGFYEWRQEGRIKQPWLFELANGAPFAMAGLYQLANPRSINSQRANSPSTDSPGTDFVSKTPQIPTPPATSCAMLTTEANEVVSDIHHRMPVILQPEDIERWLDPDSDEDTLREVLKALPAKLMKKRRVSVKINDSRQDSAELLAPPEQASLF